MNQMTRQELDDRLLDYLYDELEPSERTAFERALPAHPDVAREVEAHRATRKAYQALPREVAPAGLLAEVLAQADAEAQRRAKASAEAPVSIWERLRRIVFQPAFAMAMVVMVVAGVSLVGRKGELGIEPAPDSQHIPPVAVNDAYQGGVERVAVPQASLAPVAPVAPVTAAAPSPAEPKLEAALAEKGQGSAGDAPAIRPADPAASPAVNPQYAREVKVVGEFNAPGGVAAGSVAVDDLAKRSAIGGAAGAKNELDQADFGGTDGKTKWGPGAPPAVNDREEGADDDAPPLGDSVASDKLRNTNTVDPAPGAPPEIPTQPKKAPEPAVTPPADSAKAKKDTVRPTDVAEEQPKTPSKASDESEKKVAEPTSPQPERRVEAPKVATKDVEANRGGVAEPQKVETTEVRREAKPMEDAYTTTPDNAGRRDTDTKPATLTPPAPSSDKLWSTYQQQTAAGAYSDALRSIESLAKVEGESTRVKQARVELKKKLEAAVQPAGTNKLPPDPPVQAPK